MPAKAKHLRLVETSEKRTVRQPNAAYRTREHLTEKGVAVLLDTLRCNRHGLRDWLIGLVIYRRARGSTRTCGYWIRQMSDPRDLLRAYASYYNATRTHRSLDKDAPVHRPVQLVGGFQFRPILGGLHHQ